MWWANVTHASKVQKKSLLSGYIHWHIGCWTPKGARMLCITFSPELNIQRQRYLTLSCMPHWLSQLSLMNWKREGKGDFPPSFVNHYLLWKEYQDELLFLLWSVQLTTNGAWVRENNAALSCKWATTRLSSGIDRNQSPALCLWSCSGCCHFYNLFHVIAYLKKM